MRHQSLFVLGYLGAVVLANYLVGRFGPWVSVANTAIMIGFVLTSRDVLHEAWGTKTRGRMAALIFTGAALSYLLTDAHRIALASGAAFAVSEGADYLIFSRAKGLWSRRANLSNLGGAALDSLLFPVLAFGGFPWLICLGQFVLKVAGGAAWVALLSRARRR